MAIFQVPSLASVFRRYIRLLVPFAATTIFLSSCSSKDGSSEGSLSEGVASLSGKSADDLDARERDTITEIKKEAAQLESLKIANARVEAVMKKSLFDPSSLQLDRVRLGRNGSICGKYNAKNRMGAYVGYKDFVITKTDELVTSENNDGIDSAGENYFSYQYSQQCATKAELAAHPAETYYDEPSVDAAPPPSQRQAPDAVLDAPASSDEPADDKLPTT